MHWIRISSDEEADNGTVLFVNLTTVTSVTRENYGIQLYHSDKDTTAVGDKCAPAVLARLDALAEIATRRTQQELPQAAPVDVFDAFTKKGA